MLYEVRKDLSEAENIELDKFLVDLVRRYVETEKLFLDLVYEMGDQQDMTLEQTKDFIDYLGELRLYQCGLLSVEEVRKNPLDWIDYILSASTHTNFFEARVVDYNHGGLQGHVDYSKYTI